MAGMVACLVACNGNTKQKTHIEASESMEVEDEPIAESDEFEYLESAMNALEEGDMKLAAQNIMDAVDQIKGYIGEMDDPSEANAAITALIEIATKLKSGEKMTGDQLEEALLKFDFFSDDDLDFDDEELDYNNSAEKDKE